MSMLRRFRGARDGTSNGNDRHNNNNNRSNEEDFARQTSQLIPAEVRMISGCHSEQTSADVVVSNVKVGYHSGSGMKGGLPNPGGKSGGACTSALLDILYRYHHHNQVQEQQQQQRNNGKKTTATMTTTLTFQQVLLELRDLLSKQGYDQIPQLTSSRQLELQQTPFSMRGNGSGRGNDRDTTSSGICRALLVGINYYGQSGQLSGCHNDVWNMKEYLINVQNFDEQHILVLVDEYNTPSRRNNSRQQHFPTRNNIIKALRQLVAQSVSGDSVYFHYSGHGGLLNPEWNTFKANNSNNKEYDETVYPVDHERAGQIRDFSLFNHFVKPMPAGVTVTCVMDCCHSGSVLELPYSYQPTPAGTIRMRQNFDSLSNLAFLYVLAGGGLPPVGFGNVIDNIENVTGSNILDLQGTGIDEMDMNNTNFGGWVQPSHQDDVTGGYYDDAIHDDEPFGGVVGEVDQDVVQADGDHRGWDGNDAFGDTGEYWDGNFANGGPEGGLFDGGGYVDGVEEVVGEEDLDCSCLADVLGAILDQEQ